MNEKLCSKCKRLRPVDKFSKDRKRKDGFQPYCKDCNKTYYDAHHEKIIAGKSEYYQSNRDDKLAWQAGYREQHPQETHDAVRKSKKGMTSEQYQQMWEAQAGLCATCGKQETARSWGEVKQLAIDHDHACCPGKKSCGMCFRKLLCARCNVALGMVHDDIEVLESMVEYLKQHLSGGVTDRLPDAGKL